MKKWYQHRCEDKIGTSGMAIYLLQNNLFIDAGLSRRLSRFLFAKLYMGGVNWEYSAVINDWCCVYASSAGS